MRRWGFSRNDCDSTTVDKEIPLSFWLGFSFHRSWVPGLWPNQKSTWDLFLSFVGSKKLFTQKGIQTIQLWKLFTENENLICYWEAIQGNGLNTKKHYKQEFSFFFYFLSWWHFHFQVQFRGEPRVHSFFPGKNNWFESSSPLSKGKSATCHQTHGVDEPATIEFLPSDLSGLSF